MQPMKLIRILVLLVSGALDIGHKSDVEYHQDMLIGTIV